MERAAYFDAWYPRQHCYHPSLPPRRLNMIEDLSEYRVSMLVWSALGGGSISLPYLEQEAYGRIDPRFRFYGFLNDSEFIVHCQERGIKVFGIVFEVQGWEFPVELSDDESEVLSMNETRGAGKAGWLGLREFTQDRYPKLWQPFSNYFPEGLRNSDGEVVDDLLEECVSRDIEGAALHSTWVECPDRPHYAYLMDRNNPVWQEYLKAIARIQVDAGVAGVQLDEADLPYFATGYGGCFCRDCMKLFRAYVQQLQQDGSAALPGVLRDEDLADFDYGRWLREQGFDFKADREASPLYWEYLRCQRTGITQSFAELASYIKQYATSKGRDVLVSGNFFNFQPHYYAFEPFVDVLITEMEHTVYRQPSWYRYVRGFAGDKPVTVVENPYGGVIPELLGQLKMGRAFDRLRIMHYEAAAFGVNMSVPYGAWMGSVIEDSFWAPHELLVEVQSFLADNERLMSTSSFSETGVVFSVESAFRYAEENGQKAVFPFWEVCEQLGDEHQPFDVVMFADGTLRPETTPSERLAQYRNLVLPECRRLTEEQVNLVKAFLAGGGRVFAVGSLGENLSESVRSELFANPRLLRATSVRAADLAGGPQVVLDRDLDCAISIHRLSDREAALHIVRYDYDEAADEVPVLDHLVIEARLSRPFRMATAFSPSEGTVDVHLSGPAQDKHRLELERVPLYSVVVLQG